MNGIPSTIEMRHIANNVSELNVALGELAVACVRELLDNLREFVVETVEHDPTFARYLTAFDEAVVLEMTYLNGLPNKFKMEFGLTLYTRGMLDEMEALHALLIAPLTSLAELAHEQKEKKRKAASTLKKELKSIWPSWMPSWIEEIIESILDLL